LDHAGALVALLAFRPSRFQDFRAFSSEVETGSRQENPQIKNLEPGFDAIETEKAPEQPFAATSEPV
jgi:hypothetical protein